MKAIDFKNKFLKEEVKDSVGVIAIGFDKKGKQFWFHVHDNEELPDKDEQGKPYTIALHLR